MVNFISNFYLDIITDVKYFVMNTVLFIFNNLDKPNKFNK